MRMTAIQQFEAVRLSQQLAQFLALVRGLEEIAHVSSRNSDLGAIICGH
jgi:hypothetical protein